MKVLLINGSPHAKGCTYTALSEVAKALEEENIETEIFQIGTKPVRGCIGCGTCSKTGSGKCVFDDDTLNAGLEKAKTADGFIFGSPVHYAAASGALTSFLDRFFYAGKDFAYKPGAAIVSCRRGGAAAAFDQLNKYFTIANMPIVSSQYWNMVHGNTPEEVKQDLEGMQTMRTLGKNMAWLLKSIQAGKEAGVKLPEKEQTIRTNFIR
ncbi:multimeric flavodoxin WrbA [Clostridium acetobutylicum]|uniref:Multimeric flavodoxin WrbA family protein n=1 Tax=Clostridium acetobutylicum (strain ATCC 824 / DSM 792 / JCM 1419 / IAM 19013 / LMG 5710 / NBRC 13948 / NRRL B-527 / VKM B-1787 / 2291 / W) TaxID=272562 RepID=Q97DX9_CLOAB|nr:MULTISPECIES: flavodoxin family protein [Clostridium]AAK81273.1 Multimeric flavodoxin WrbA family protein [Clostridium acetobutylicum ATCC 824]ADZ22381.1 Multimeric flavodoxin WrbA family protein [Clostridium acetobutylicum EA 2018]AEI32782.1 multimeric flavodoxin WrbA family protein [Clostridium acetobutylicum DSM 1731]AWV81059.1 flavodoxin family protein [Clostridium acetobutylicum]MBC2395574.1 flavodoxin family protein [Clostridium acetobutylicum]